MSYSHGSIAAKVAARKELHPSEYCTAKRCLWRTGGPMGTPCKRHPMENLVQSFGAERFDLTADAAKRSAQHAESHPLPAEPSYAERHDRDIACRHVQVSVAKMIAPDRAHGFVLYGQCHDCQQWLVTDARARRNYPITTPDPSELEILLTASLQ